MPTEGWIRAIDRFIALSPPDRRFGRLARPGASWGARAAALVRRPAVVPGDLVRPERAPRHARAAAAPGADLSASVERDPVFG